MPARKLKGLNLDKEKHKGKWFLSWLGQVDHDPISGSKKVTVWLFAIIEDKLAEGLSYDDPGVCVNTPTVRRIGVGYLSIIKIGMVIDSFGTVISTPLEYSKDRREFNIEDVLSDSKKRFLHNYIIQGKITLENPKGIFANYPFPYVANSCPCYIFEQGGLNIIIPKFVIAQHFLFSSSSKIIEEIFSGRLEQMFWIDKAEKNIDIVDKKMVVAKGVKKTEADFLARIAFVDKAASAVRYICSSVRRAYNFYKETKPEANVFFNTDFPFEGGCSIYTVGRQIHYNGNDNFFLVYQILDTNYILPYRSVDYDYHEDNRSGENKDDPNLLKKSNNNSVFSIPKDLERVDFNVEQQPASNTQQGVIEIENDHVNYFNIKKPEVKPNDKILQEYKYSGKILLIENYFTSVSTTLEGGSNKDVGKVNILKSKPLSMEDGEDYLDNFFNLLGELNNLFTLTYIKLNNDKGKDHRISKLPTSYYKAIDISEHLDFCFYNPFDGRDLLRRIVIAELKISNMYFYLIEIDPYGLGSNGLRTATVCTRKLEKIDTVKFPNSIIFLLRHTVIYEGNFSLMDEEKIFYNLYLKSIRSNHKQDQTLGDYAKKHVSKIIKIIKDEDRIVPTILEDYVSS